MAHNETIATYNLSRMDDDVQGDVMYDFMTPFIGDQGDQPADLWNHQLIHYKDLSKDMVLFNYATCVERGAFIIWRAFITTTKQTDPPTVPEEIIRFTDMRMWQMVIDSWRAAGGQPAALKYLGVSQVVNPAGTAALATEKTRQNAQPGQTIVTVPADATWSQNPFTLCGSRVARALSLMIPTTVRVQGHLKRPGDYDPESDGVNMVIEFGDFEEIARPTAIQDLGAKRNKKGNATGQQDTQALEDEQDDDVLTVRVTIENGGL